MATKTEYETALASVVAFEAAIEQQLVDLDAQLAVVGMSVNDVRNSLTSLNGSLQMQIANAGE